MANTFTAFAETLIAAAGEYNEAAVGQTSIMDQVYTEVSTEAARVGKTVDVWYPDVSPLKDIGANDPVPTALSPNYAPLVFQNHPCGAIQVQDYEQFQTATEIATKFLDPLHKRSREYLNGAVASLITPTNFSANAPIIGSKAAEVQVTDQLSAWSNLADNKCPMEDPNDLALLVHNTVQKNMFADSAWVQENIISAAIAEKARTEAKLANAYGFRPIWDQQMPATSGQIIYGAINLTNGSATVTAQNSAFTTQLAVGSYLTFGSDPTKTQYKVSAIASDTSLTLSAAYGGSTVSGTTARLYTVLAGTVGATNGSAAVTGSGTSFTTALSVGQWLIFSNDPTNTPYQILSITSSTALTLATNYAGTTATGLTATVQSYTCLALHKYAIALSLRPIATPASAMKSVEVVYLNLRGIPLRVMRSYVHIYMAEFVTVDFGYALGVVRPQWGQIIQV